MSPSFAGRNGNFIIAGSPLAVGAPGYNASIKNTPFAFRNGNTNLAGGNQGLSFNTPNWQFSGGLFSDPTELPATFNTLVTNSYGYAEIPGDTPGVDFNTTGGNGTIEAVLYLEPSSINVLSM